MKTTLKHSRDTSFLDLNSNHPFLMYKLFATLKPSVGETDRKFYIVSLLSALGRK